MLEQSIQAVSDLAKHSHVKNVSIRVLRTPWWNPVIIPDVAGVCVLGALHCVLQGMMFDLILLILVRKQLMIRSIRAQYSDDSILLCWIVLCIVARLHLGGSEESQEVRSCYTR